MNNYYLDESGDLGFTEKSSKFYILSVYKAKYPKKIDRIVKNIRKNVFRKKDKKKIELKFHDSTERIRQHLLKKISNEDIDIYSLTLNKSKCNKLKENKSILNQYMTIELLKKIPLTENGIILTIDKQLNNNRIKEYNITIKGSLIHYFSCMDIYHKNSLNDTCLQVADFIVGAFFQKHEYKKEWYYEIIQEKIINDDYLQSK